ncbi:MAG: HEAT repeat domain-containing protein [Planctomycetota bacterium]
MSRFFVIVFALYGAGLISVLPGVEVLVAVDHHKLFEEARQLHRDGDDRAAFLKFMQLKGGEAAAIAVARSGGKAKDFLDLLRENSPSLLAARVKLVEGELLLALKDKAGALKCYRYAAALIETQKGEPRPGMLPREIYFVEASEPNRPEGLFSSELNRLIPPFMVGPGSHRDNRLIRRFIALEAWEDAEREFARAWELHREAAQPYVMSVQVWDVANDTARDRPVDALHAENVNPLFREPRIEKRLFRPAGFNGQGLQFVLDYAYFLQRHKSRDAARNLLFEPLLAIDMDRNPNAHQTGDPIAFDKPLPAPERQTRSQVGWGFDRSSGVSRKEFLRLVYGDFHTHREVELLFQRLNDRIAAKDNRARRTLARILGHHGETDKSLQLELDYIKAGKFEPLTAAYRMGLVFDDARNVVEATTAFEKVRELPIPKDATANVPDVEEVTSDSGRFAQSLIIGYWGRGEATNQLKSIATQHLLRLYASQGLTEKVLDLKLELAESNANTFSNVDVLEQLVQQFRAAKQEDRIKQWLQKHLQEAKSPEATANLCWVIGDRERAIELAASSSQQAFVSSWKERLRAAGPDPFKQFLTLVVKSNPKDAVSRLELLDLNGLMDGPEMMECFELLLASDAQSAFARGKGQRNQTRFSGYPELAYRLMRLYQRHGKIDALSKLGLRIARGEKPFDAQTQRWNSRGLNERESEDWGNACLALAIQYADDPAGQQQLADALRDSHWSAARNQLARRMAGPWKPLAPVQPIPWANAPAGVTLLVSHHNVLSLAHDAKFVYAGFPWGIAVYTHSGRIVTQIALEEAARTLAVMPGRVWVGTPKGLFHVTTETWKVAYQSLDGDNDQHQSELSSRTSGVNTLTIDGDLLWIGLNRNIQVLNTKTLELRAFSIDELNFRYGGDVQKIDVDGNYVWADSSQGIRRWDRATDEWASVESVGPRDPIHLIAIIDGTLYGDAYVDDQLRHRLCTIDRDSLVATPIPLVAKPDRQMINHSILYAGKSQAIHNQTSQPAWAGKLIFQTELQHYYLDNQANQLRPFPESTLEKIFASVRQREEKRTPAGSRHNAILRILDLRKEVFANIGVSFTKEGESITLPDGTLVVGRRLGRTRYEYPTEDRPNWSESLHDFEDSDGGLYFVTTKENGPVETRTIVIGESPLRADRCFGVVQGDNHEWVCTERGLVVLDRKGQVADRFTRSDGLCANRVVGGAILDGVYYFATAWDDSNGGLAVLEPKTSTFTSLHDTDGMSTDKLRSVAVKDGRLKLTFALEYLRYTTSDSLRWRLHPPATYDPKTSLFESGGVPKLMNDRGLAGIDPFGPVTDEPDPVPERLPNGAVRMPVNRFKAMPYLGGHIIQRQLARGSFFVCGTRGVAIIHDHAAVDAPLPAIPVAQLGAKLADSVSSRQLADARERTVTVKNEMQLAEALQDPNPVYAAKVLAAWYLQHPGLKEEDLPLIANAITSRNRRLRSTALAVLLRQRKMNDQLIPLLKEQLNNPHRSLRSAAMLQLARQGVVSDVAGLQDYFRREETCTIPYGADSAITLETSFNAMHVALAPHAAKDVFEVLLKNPPRLGNGDNKTTVFPQLGKSLARNPESLPILLKVRGETGQHDARVEFVNDVLRFAGKELLPALHLALQSEDRVVRSNAARGCGTLHDQSSIDPLLKSLDLESGLSRASIVWALGELKAKSAIPVLAKLYVDARNDEKRYGSGARGGFRASQSAAVMDAQYDTLSSVDAIGDDWNELKRTSFAAAVDPRNQEVLLEPRHILEAISKIGSAESQGFYRTLAAESGPQFREEAAVQLGSADVKNRLPNIDVLKSLLTDNSPQVSIAAATSLVILGNNEGQQLILDNLKSINWAYALKHLERVGRGQCRFARAEIEAIARDASKSAEIQAKADAMLMDQAQ